MKRPKKKSNARSAGQKRRQAALRAKQEPPYTWYIEQGRGADEITLDPTGANGHPEAAKVAQRLEGHLVSLEEAILANFIETVDGALNHTPALEAIPIPAMILRLISARLKTKAA